MSVTFKSGVSVLDPEKHKRLLADIDNVCGIAGLQPKYLRESMKNIYTLADILGCSKIFIDGGYLVRHKNARLDRFNRAPENCGPNAIQKCCYNSLQTLQVPLSSQNPRSGFTVRIDLA
jgi:hypothetical protein